MGVKHTFPFVCMPCQKGDHEHCDNHSCDCHWNDHDEVRLLAIDERRKKMEATLKALARKGPPEEK